jgi:hypothetical protein
MYCVSYSISRTSLGHPKNQISINQAIYLRYLYILELSRMYAYYTSNFAYWSESIACMDQKLLRFQSRNLQNFDVPQLLMKLDVGSVSTREPIDIGVSNMTMYVLYGLRFVYWDFEQD